MTRVLVSLGCLLALGAVASAQPAPNDLTIGSFDPDSAVAPISTVEGPGWKVGEGTVVHPVIGLETGYISNVFYEANNPADAGVLRLLAQIGTGSLSPERLTPAGGTEGDDSTVVRKGSLEYRASARASYDLMLSGDQAISGTGGLGLGGTFRGMVNPDGAWSLGFDEEYSRLIRAANFETDADTNRDINSLNLNVLWHPQDRSFGGYLYYQNTFDVFERSTQQFADRFQNLFGLHPMWRWLPQTTVYADLSAGVYTGLGSSSIKVSSYPLTGILGISTLLSPKITVNVQAGYTDGLYSSGPSYSGIIAGAAVGYRYSPLGRVALTYDLQYNDSINANFYRDHIVRLWVYQMFVPFLVMVQPEVHFREYDGINIPGIMPSSQTRDDTIFSVVAGIHYNFRNSLAATLDYHYSQVATDFRYIDMGSNIDPSYVRHELLLGVRAAL